jgi:histidinol-phosphate aminotransferase
VSVAPRYRWQPTTAEIAAMAGVAAADVVRFDHNTSPFPTEWAVELAATAARSLNEYPGASYRPIREAVASSTGVGVEQVAVGAGIDELILLAGRAFLAPGARAAAITPTYPLYEISTLQVGAGFTRIPASPPDFAFPFDHVIDAARDADVTWLCVPDNPTGSRLGNEQIAAIIAATDGLVVLDAAYAEFAGDGWAEWVHRHHNLLVMHTLSKAYGVGGIRVGYGLGHPGLVDAIDAVRPPGSIASISVEVAMAALASPERMRGQVAAIAAERTRLGAELDRLGFRVLPSLTNFLLCEVGASAGPLGGALMRRGLVVRTYGDGGPLEGYLRFTVRSRDEDDRLIRALEEELT